MTCEFAEVLERWDRALTQAPGLVLVRLLMHPRRRMMGVLERPSQGSLNSWSVWVLYISSKDQ